MRILIEEYRYKADDVRETIHGIDALEDIEGYVSVNYVGYYFNSHPDIYDCVFILPKVLLEVKNGQELVFGHLSMTSRCGSTVLSLCSIMTNATIHQLSITRRWPR